MAHDHGTSSASKTRLLVVIASVSVVLVAEVLGAIFTGSLALLADAGHMTSDLIGLLISLTALIVATRPATDRATYGYRRAEVFGALANGLILCVVAVGIAIEAVSRLIHPSEEGVVAGPMLIIAIVGLVTNLVSMLILRSGAKHSINLRGAYLEVFGDMLGSLAVIVAAIIILTTGWMQADVWVSLLIAAGIAPRAWSLLRDVWRVLNESTPAEMDVDELRRHLNESPRVAAIHDIHVWSITPGHSVFTAHISVQPEVFDRGEVAETLTELSGCLRDHFDLQHVTLQLEPIDYAVTEDGTHR